MNLQENVDRIKEVMLLEQRIAFLNIFPTVNSLVARNAMGYNQINGNDNTNIIYLTRRDKITGNEIPNSKFSYKVSGSYGIINFDIILRNVRRNRGNGKLTAEVKPTNGAVASIMKKLIPSYSLTNDGWLEIEVSLDELNTSLIQLYNNKGSSAEIKVDGGVTINLKQIQ